MKHYNEEETLLQLQSSDTRLQNKAFESIVTYYSERLYYYIRKIVISHDDANDILQNSFIKAWMNIGLFRGESRLSTWLYKIALNESMTFLNKQNTQNIVSLDNADSYLTDKLISDDYIECDEINMNLQKAVLTLPDKQRAVFNMRYFDDMSYEDMSDIMGTSVGALKSSYHYAVKKIEEFLNRD